MNKFSPKILTRNTSSKLALKNKPCCSVSAPSSHPSPQAHFQNLTKDLNSCSGYEEQPVYVINNLFLKLHVQESLNLCVLFCFTTCALFLNAIFE